MKTQKTTFVYWGGGGNLLKAAGVAALVLSMAYACTQPNALLGRGVEETQFKNVKLKVGKDTPENPAPPQCITIVGFQPLLNITDTDPCNDRCTSNNRQVLPFCINVSGCTFPSNVGYVAFIITDPTDFPSPNPPSAIAVADIGKTLCVSMPLNDRPPYIFPYSPCGYGVKKYLYVKAQGTSSVTLATSKLYKIGVHQTVMNNCPL